MNKTDTPTTTQSNRYAVIERLAVQYNSSIQRPTGEPRILNVGSIIVLESVSNNGNVWFLDSTGERFKVESGSLENMSDRIRQMSFEELNGF